MDNLRSIAVVRHRRCSAYDKKERLLTVDLQLPEHCLHGASGDVDVCFFSESPEAFDAQLLRLLVATEQRRSALHVPCPLR
uniref:Uncharacterized protein n=1 Tax=Steinernema glaseri TaxID=37863 RepID=A0A1I7YK93_9BILA